MDQIRTSILDSEPEPGRERANLIRVKLEPKMEEDHLGLDQSDWITTNVESEELDSQKRIKHGTEIMNVSRDTVILGPREFNVAKFGTHPGQSARLIWGVLASYGSIYKPEGNSRNPIHRRR